MERDEKEFAARVGYYESIAKRVLDQFGGDFREFTKNEKRLVELGDHLLRNRHCTGYNLLLNDSAMLLDSKESLIFYSNYIRRTNHFAILLATFEREGLITDENIGFGSRASKTIYDESWGTTSLDERIRKMRFREAGGKRFTQKVVETVETVLTFKPTDDDTALAIADRLFDLTSEESAISIPGSWYIPDIRATSSLKSVLTHGNVGFHEVIANIFSKEASRLIILKKITSFDFPWKSFPIGLNYELIEFLTGFGVSP